MRIAIDALPINNLSGRHVLLGHIEKLAAAHKDKHEFIILHHHANRDIRRDFGQHVSWVECEGVGANWQRRLLWQFSRLEQRLKRLKIDWMISTSGALVPGISQPQIVLAQNPWCYFPQFHKTFLDRIKAASQRRGYRSAQRRAKGMFYLSDYVAQMYRSDAGCKPASGDVLYVGIDESTFSSASENHLSFEKRNFEILTVSCMARLKSVEDVVHAVAKLHTRDISANLTLVGPWSDEEYRNEIEELIERLDLTDNISICGKVSKEELHNHYRRARVFCLLSRCESFGIPAVEAQAFGTPTVVADICAPPEVAGPGGKIVPPGDIEAAANGLESLLTQSTLWKDYSERALQNAERFRWTRVSDPLSRFLGNLS